MNNSYLGNDEARSTWGACGNGTLEVTCVLIEK